MKWIAVDVDIRAGCSCLVVMMVIAHFRPTATDEATPRTSAGRLGRVRPEMHAGARKDPPADGRLGGESAASVEA